MKTKLLILTIATPFCLWSQNIGINTTGATPDNSAMLDVASTSKGLLIPRVNLTATNAAGPITTPATSLLVYNLATAGVAPNNVTPGYYFWDGTAWQRFDTGNNVGDWKINGNGNTTAGTNFLGTTNPQALDFRTNNTIRFQIANGDQVFAMANGTSALPFYSWNSDPNMGIYRNTTDVMGLVTNGTERFRIPNANQVHAMSLGTTALPFYSFSADDNTGMWSSSGDRLNFSTNAIERLEIGTTETVINDVSNNHDFRVESDGNANMLFVDAGNNRVGIGTNTPAEELHVNGDFRIDGDFYNQQILEDSQLGWNPGSNNTWLNTPLSISATTSGSGATQSEVYVSVSGSFFSVADQFGVRIMRDGVFLCGGYQDAYIIVEESGQWSFAFSTIDNPTAGAHTYTVQINVSDSSTSNDLVEGYFNLLEIKK